MFSPYHAPKHRKKSKKSFKSQALTLPVLLPCLSVTERMISAANVSPSLIYGLWHEHLRMLGTPA